jgi:hypothetical protein
MKLMQRYKVFYGSGERTDGRAGLKCPVGVVNQLIISDLDAKEIPLAGNICKKVLAMLRPKQFRMPESPAWAGDC